MPYCASRAPAASTLGVISLGGQSWNSEFKLLIPRLIQVSRHRTNEFCTYDADLRDRQLSADWNTGTPDTVNPRGGP